MEPPTTDHVAPPPFLLPQDRTSRIRDINGYTWQLMEVHGSQVGCVHVAVFILQ